MSAKELEELTAKKRAEVLGTNPQSKKNNAFIEKSLKRGQDLLGKIEQLQSRVDQTKSGKEELAARIQTDQKDKHFL